MMDIFFFSKTFILTMAIVLVMQIQIGKTTLETHAMSWVQDSSVVAPLRSVAGAAALVVHDLSHKISYEIHGNVHKGKNQETAASKQESAFHWLHSYKEQKSEE